MDQVFFEELRLPKPRHNLRVGSGTHAEETGRIMIGVERILSEEKPDVVLVEGDTNTVLAAALASVKLHVKVGHVEAGLRSRDMSMPEEINRIVADHVSCYLYAPTESARRNLLDEGIDEKKVFVTGNTVVDSVRQNLNIAERETDILDELNINREGYVLATAHRAENVDVMERLRGILDSLELIYREFGLPIIYPVHPRTTKRMQELGLNVPDGTRLIEPLGYLQFLQLERNAKIVMTDSGGVQEETCVLGVPCVTMRENTERPETLEVGSNILVGTCPQRIFEGVRKMLAARRNWKNPFGDGNAAGRIVDTLEGAPT